MQKIERAADVGGKQAGDQAKAGDVFFLFGYWLGVMEAEIRMMLVIVFAKNDSLMS